MSEIALIGADASASGHPTECTEPVSGSIDSASSHNITVTTSSGTAEVATTGNSNISFSSHSHDYSESEGCHDNQSHSITGSGDSSITINGNAVYRVENGVATDPITGGNVDITGNPFTTNIQ